MQDNSESITCPQTTVTVFAVIYSIFAIASLSFYTVFLPPISILIAIFVILGIKTKKYVYYICGLIISIVRSITETIIILIVIINLLSYSHYDERKNEYNYGYNNPLLVFVSFVFAMLLFFIWIESSVLIFYNKRVRYHCENNTVRTIRNEFSQPLV